nr:peptidylprolyl isomerase [Aeoliella straminimaris]
MLLFTTIFSVAPACYAQTPGDAGPKKLQGAEVIARIDKQVILASDLLWEVRLLIERNTVPPEQVDEATQFLMQQQLRGYIDTKLMYADFRRNAPGADMKAIRGQLNDPFYNGGGSGKSPGSVPGLMDALEVDNMQDLEAKLHELGTSLADRKEAFVEKAIAQTWASEQIRVDKPTYTQLLDYYQKHKEDYAYPTQAKWEELVVQFSNHPSKEAARKKLVVAGNLLWRRVQQQPAVGEPVFTDVARKYSESYTAEDGGLHGWTTKGALVDTTLDTALFTLPVGALSPIIETASGLQIVRVVDRREAGYTQFADLQDEIQKKMTNESFQEKMQEHLGKLRGETRIWTIYTGDTTAQAFLESPPSPVMRR